MVQCPEDMAQYTIFQEDKDMRNWKKVLLAVVPDGEAECYCFDNDGYALVSLYNLTSKAAGYDVNMDGAWVENGEVQVQPVME